MVDYTIVYDSPVRFIDVVYVIKKKQKMYEHLYCKKQRHLAAETKIYDYRGSDVS